MMDSRSMGGDQKVGIRRSGRRGRGRSPHILAILAAVIVVLPAFLLAMAPPVSAYGPGKGTYFKYYYDQGMDSQEGAYDGYDEGMTSDGHYEVLGRTGDVVSLHAYADWEYWNSDGGDRSGVTDRYIEFSVSTRRYTSDFIDLDEPLYASMDPSDLCVWFWIPPDLSEGDEVCILDDVGEVTDADYTLWIGVTPYKVVEVVMSGSAMRDDSYGRFSYDYTDRLYFEKRTGMFVAERYEEEDVGYWNEYGTDEYAEFRIYINMDYAEASYDVEVDWLAVLLIIFFIVLIIAVLAYVAYRFRWRSRSYIIRGHNKVRFRRVRKMRDFPHLRNNASTYFGYFLELWTRKALKMKDPVVVATNPSGGLLGIAIHNKEAKIGTIFSPDSDITENLRHILKVKDFFSEVRHKVNVTPDMYEDIHYLNQLRQSNNEAYNVFEDYKVYILQGIREVGFDARLVRPMTPADLPAVTSLAKNVYGGECKRWIRGCFADGDLSYVAVVDGAIVGFGFAEVTGTYGRLHTLGVHLSYRNRGIGKELHRARLEAMRLMGVSEVVDEIADWNLASIRISTLSGFQPVGKLYVETSRTSRIKMNIMRR